MSDRIVTIHSKWHVFAGTLALVWMTGPLARAQETRAGHWFLKKATGDCTACPPACPPIQSPCAPMLTKPGLPSTDTGAPPSATAPGQTPGSTPDGAAQSPNVQLGDEGSGAGGGDTFAVAAPNMIGDLLYSSRSVQYSFLRTTGNTNFFSQASTGIVNASVAENNSPVPADRVYLRYNYFRNGQSVTGISPETLVLQPDPLILLQLPATKKYDVNLVTIGGEKTFFSGLMSVEVRLPVVTTLSPRNIFAAGMITNFTGDVDPNGNPRFDVVTTPENTLGSTSTEFGNMSVIGKALLWGDRTNGLYVSGGAGVGIPTAPDTLVRIIDYASTSGSLVASSQRLREVRIANDTVALSPFFAALYTPNDRLFTQGFFQVEIPLNPSPIRYNDVQLMGSFGTGGNPIPPGSLVPPFQYNDHIREQTLLHLDWGTGYWVYRQPENKWLTGIAPSVEVHYTGALADADRVQLPGDATAAHFDPSDPLGAFLRGDPQIPEAGPTVGGIHKRLNIVNVTAGSTFLIGQRTTLAAAVAVPVTSGFNRTFDWEAQVQLNYYFGGPATRPPQIAPPF